MNVLINIDVNDVELGLQFYTTAFDLRVGRRFGTDGVELLGASSPIYLLTKMDGTNACCIAGHVRDYARHWTPVHLDIAVTNLDAAVKKAIGAGATLERDAQTNTWGRIALLADPFGHGFCLIQFTDVGYDSIATN